jgi:hypothetical protein
MMRSPVAIFGAYHGQAVAVEVAVAIEVGRCADTHTDAVVASIVRRRDARCRPLTSAGPDPSYLAGGFVRGD